MAHDTIIGLVGLAVLFGAMGALAVGEQIAQRWRR